MAYQKLNYVAVDDLALPDDWNQMIDNQDWFNTLFNRGYIPAGLDADKPASPRVGDTYYATDTRRLYRCLAAGVWDGGLTVDTLAAARSVAYAPVDVAGAIRQANGVISFRRVASFETAWGDTGPRWFRVASMAANDMVRVHIRGLSYSTTFGTKGAFDIFITFYVNTSTGAVQNVGIHMLGTHEIGQKVKVTHDGSYVYVVLGDASTAWRDTWVTVDVDAGFGAADADWQDTLFVVYSGTEPTWTQEITYASMSKWPGSGLVSSTAEFATTSTTYVNVLSLPVVTASGRVLVGATAPRLRNDDGAQSISLRLVVGTQADGFFTSVCYALNPSAHHARVFDLGAAGSYTAALQAKVSGNTGRVNFGALGKITLWYIEV